VFILPPPTVDPLPLAMFLRPPPTVAPLVDASFLDPPPIVVMSFRASLLIPPPTVDSSPDAMYGSVRGTARVVVKIGFGQYMESESYRDGAVSVLCMLVVFIIFSVIRYILDIKSMNLSIHYSIIYVYHVHL
jgi:hypothetical protein